MTTSHICIMIAIIVYLGAMIYVGYLCSKKNNDTSDFYLGGRKLGPLVTAMSAEASDMSSWLLMGLPGLAYLSGIADAGWTAIGLAIGTYLNWKIVAKRIRLYTHVAGNSITLPSFFSNRFRDNRHLLQSIGAVFIVIFFIPYTASGFADLWKTFLQPFWSKISHSNDHQCPCYSWIYDSRRISCRINNGLYPEHHHVYCTDHRILFWGIYSRRSFGGY